MELFIIFAVFSVIMILKIIIFPCGGMEEFLKYAPSEEDK